MGHHRDRHQGVGHRRHRHRDRHLGEGHRDRDADRQKDVRVHRRDRHGQEAAGSAYRKESEAQAVAELACPTATSEEQLAPRRDRLPWRPERLGLEQQQVAQLAHRMPQPEPEQLALALPGLEQGPLELAQQEEASERVGAVARCFRTMSQLASAARVALPAAGWVRVLLVPGPGPELLVLVPELPAQPQGPRQLALVPEPVPLGQVLAQPRLVELRREALACAAVASWSR